MRALLPLLALSLFLFAAAQAHGADVPTGKEARPATGSPAFSSGGGWPKLVDQGVRLGIERPLLKSVTGKLAKAQLSPAQGGEILSPAFDAAREGLPVPPVIAKIDEGLLKGADARALTLAAQNRYLALRRAKDLLVANRWTLRSKQGQGLLVSTAHALESGLPEACLQAALRAGKGMPAAQMKSVVEAGEALHLGGFEPQAVEALMTDCLTRNLRKQEVLRAVRFAVEKRRSGMSGAEVRQALWGGGAKGL